MDLKIILDPTGFDHPTVDAMFRTASQACKIWPNHYDEAREEFRALALDWDHNQVLVGTDGTNAFKTTEACAITLLPYGKLFMPQQFMFLCTGSDKLRLTMVRRCVDFVKSRGYNKGQTANATGVPDEAWLRYHGLQGRTAGSLIEFSF